MNQFDRDIKKLAQEEKREVPDEIKQKIEETLSVLPESDRKVKIYKVWPRVLATAACLVLAFVFVLPNVSPVYAETMEKIPIIGDLIHVVTIRNYKNPDKYHEMEMDIPNVSDSDSGTGADEINGDVDKLTEELVREFYEDMDAVSGEGRGSIKLDYEVLTNNKKWFTLKLTVNKIMASSSTTYRYYHIDRKTGKSVELGDIFRSSDYSKIIADNIKEQMKEQMKEDSNKIYWIDKEDFGTDFAEISADHNFYFDNSGNLVIPFDKYEVSPGYMGCPEFKVEKAVFRELLKDNYKNIAE